MLKRILTVLIAVPIIFACVYFGGPSFFVLVSALALLSLNEFYGLMNKKQYSPSYAIGFMVTIFLISFISFTVKHPNWEPYATGILTTAIIITFVGGLFLKKAQDSTLNASITLLGILYIGWMFSYLILLREFTDHGAYLMFLLVAVWACDTFAYLVGTYFGKVKLAPYISPHKTVEGSVAGFVISIVAAFIFSQFAGINPFHAVILGTIIGVVSQISDLVESLIKRDVGVKDSSHLVPGHGGFLDRVDSFILTAPIMYYYIIWFVQ
jgi:phosphatidate cytidylyltransferase